jgi:hypothetical protein
MRDKTDSSQDRISFRLDLSNRAIKPAAAAFTPETKAAPTSVRLRFNGFMVGSNKGQTFNDGRLKSSMPGRIAALNGKSGTRGIF